MHDDVELTAFGVLCGGHEVHAVLRDQSMDLTTVVRRGIRVVDGNGVATLMRHHLHRGDVGFPVADEDHPRKRECSLLLRRPNVDVDIVPGVPFSEANIQTAIERLRSREPLGLMKLNEKTTDLLQLGTSLDQTIEGEMRGRSLKYIDWSPEGVANNVFHVTKEFYIEQHWLQQDPTTRHRPLRQWHPLCVIECKGPNEDFDQAISQLIGRQNADEIPHLIPHRSAAHRDQSQQGALWHGGNLQEILALWREKEIKEGF